MPSIGFVSSFYNPADFSKNVKNCEKFLLETIGCTVSDKDFFFCEVKSKQCKGIGPRFLPQNYLQLNSESILWHKERCFNLLIKQFNLYNKYDYIMWLDTDVLFDKEVLAPKEDWDAFQPYSTSLRQSDKNGTSFQRFTAWVKDNNGDKGLGWAIKSSILKKVGGFFDYGIVGGSDYYFINKMSGKDVCIGCPNFDKELNNYFKGNEIPKNKVGYLDNTVTHLYHGKPSSRQYDSRIEILRKHNFNPLDDMVVEKSGLYRLVNKDFENDVKHYFLGREEDD